MARSKMAVIGLGNRLLADEGAGLHAIDLLRAKLDAADGIPMDVDLVEAGTPGMNLLHQFDGREKIIFLDAGNCGVNAGQYRRFAPDEAISLKKAKGYSLHEFDLIGFLEFAKCMNMTENVDIVIYCVQAAELVMAETVSPVVGKTLPGLVRDVYDEVKKGIRGGEYA
ncbi:MAG: hydrogenase maturation protease [bacterium]|nr:hydrogenase maturation protease [bacterium]